MDALNRRDFLKAAVFTATAAVATGGAVALLNHEEAACAPAATAVTPHAAPVLPVGQDPNELLALLAESQANNVRLQAELASVQAQLAALQTNQGLERETLTTQLGSVTHQAGVLTGLVALYEQLEQVGVPSLAAAGVTAVGTALTDLMSGVPSLDEGLVMGEQALAGIEAHLPTLENGRIWLGSHLETLRGYYDAVATVLSTAVETAGSFLQMLNEWFQDVLSWLPFGMGQKAQTIMQALTDLLAETPNTLSGLASNILGPLDVWLVSGDPNNPEIPLQTNVIQPLRENVLLKTSAALQKAQTVQTTYNEQLATPLTMAVQTHQEIQTRIAEYRQQNQV